jgi:hypothetical protein
MNLRGESARAMCIILNRILLIARQCALMVHPCGPNWMTIVFVRSICFYDAFACFSSRCKVIQKHRARRCQYWLHAFVNVKISRYLRNDWRNMNAIGRTAICTSAAPLMHENARSRLTHDKYNANRLFHMFAISIILLAWVRVCFILVTRLPLVTAMSKFLSTNFRTTIEFGALRYRCAKLT